MHLAEAEHPNRADAEGARFQCRVEHARADVESGMIDAEQSIDLGMRQAMTCEPGCQWLITRRFKDSVATTAHDGAVGADNDRANG